MQSLTVKTKIVCFIFLSAVGIQAQQPASQGAATAGAVPRLVRFAGSFHAPAGQPPGPIGATLAIYNEPEGGTPLWTEEQNVELDAAGNYSVLLGSTKNEGVPAELFGANDLRWLAGEIQCAGCGGRPARIAGKRALCIEGSGCRHAGWQAGLSILDGCAVGVRAAGSGGGGRGGNNGAGRRRAGQEVRAAGERDQRHDGPHPLFL